MINTGVLNCHPYTPNDLMNSDAMKKYESDVVLKIDSSMDIASIQELFLNAKTDDNTNIRLSYRLNSKNDFSHLANAAFQLGTMVSTLEIVIDPHIFDNVHSAQSLQLPDLMGNSHVIIRGDGEHPVDVSRLHLYLGANVIELINLSWDNVLLTKPLVRASVGKYFIAKSINIKNAQIMDEQPPMPGPMNAAILQVTAPLFDLDVWPDNTNDAALLVDKVNIDGCRLKTMLRMDHDAGRIFDFVTMQNLTMDNNTFDLGWDVSSNKCSFVREANVNTSSHQPFYIIKSDSKVAIEQSILPKNYLETVTRDQEKTVNRDYR